MAKQRLGWIDIAKGIAIIAVILGHTYGYGNPVHAFVYSFHIPLFFILAGYTSRVKTFNEVIVSSKKRLLLPYAALCAFIAVSALINPALSIGDTGWIALGFIFAAGGDTVPFGIPGVGLAWFLMALFIARVLFNGTLVFFERHRTPELIRFVAYVLLALLAVVVSKHCSLPLALNQSLVAMLFMYVGYVLKTYGMVKWLDKLWVIVPLAIAWFVLLWLGVFFSIGNMFYMGSFLLGLVMTVSGSLAIIRFSVFLDRHCRRVSGFLSFAGINSLLLLCLHQVESAFINWQQVVFVSAGDLSFVVAGLAHLALVFLLAYLVVLNPIVFPAENKIAKG